MNHACFSSHPSLNPILNNSRPSPCSHPVLPPAILNVSAPTQVDSGQLSLDDYLAQLRAAVPAEKTRSKQFKARGAVRQALDAFKHANIMQQELEEALKQGEQ